MSRKQQVIDTLNRCNIPFSKIAENTGLSAWTVQKIARGITKNPSYDDIEALYKYLSTPLIEQKDND